MALAMQPKKKLKNRSSRRSASTRAFEEEDEDMAIISRLEKEPWQPDLLLERQSDKTASSNPFLSSSSSTETTAAATTSNTLNSNTINGTTATTVTTNAFDKPSPSIEASPATLSGGFKGMIPVIIKSPSSVITTADSDCVESIFEDHSPKIPGIHEYLQQTHREQLLLQQQRLQKQQEVQLQLQYQLPSHLAQQNKISNVNNATVADIATTLTNSDSGTSKIRSNVNTANNNSTRRQTSQQYRNSFHGHSAPFLGLDEHRSSLISRPLSIHEPQARSESPLNKVVTDNEDVIESLQSLKNLAMLALDGLLQQVVSDVTASDPVYNADEATLQARAVIRRKSIPLLRSEERGQDHSDNQGGLRTPDHEQEQQSLSYLKGSDPQLQEASTRRTTERMSLSDMPIAGMATSSLERLDELARKVDQLTAVTNTTTDTTSPSSLFRAQDVLHEPLDIPSNSNHGPSTLSSSPHLRRQQYQSTQQAQHQLASPSQLHPSQIFESQEYQLACALAALLACIYRILNTMQEPRLPTRTESADSGLDQASRLWKRLSSNSFVRNPLRASQSNQSNLRESLFNSSDSIGNGAGGSSLPSSPEKRVLTHPESATGGFIQSINRQVRIMRSRRTQSTSQIEVQKTTHSADLGKRPVRSMGGPSLHPEDATQSEKARNLEREWGELDKLMDEMSFLWQAVGSLEDDQDVDIDSQSDEERDRVRVMATNPFDDSHATRQQRRVSTISTWTPMTPAPDFDRQTLDMAALDDLPHYDDVAPQYRTYEKSDQATTPADSSQAKGGMTRLAHRTSRGNMSGLDDEKTRFDLHNVMGAIERLSRVAPRMDNQRVQMSPTQKKQIAQANVNSTIDQISRYQWGERAGSSSSSAVRRQSAVVDPNPAEKSRDLNKLMNQIAESAKAGFTTQRAEFSPRQQWKLEGARIGDKIERGEKMRLKDQDWVSPESVLIKDMTRLTNALYQQTASTEAFETQRFTMTEDKARNMALQGILSKIERVSGRRMGNQDALPPVTKSKPSSTSSSSSENKYEDESSRARELQEMIDQVVGSGGGPKRRTAMASQRAEFNPPVPRS
ncbi:hypothetical protein BGZ96_006969 [Linnemannia gamsii]|uniref:Uncharacterized protein n=1 Tax=Linnemannia gamsii TaxID=64522 RepID=A0ABQ7K1N6_9FUNG|nr:hypothetical protein BGZ96_006969 [Linnemannia gamsii]